MAFEMRLHDEAGRPFTVPTHRRSYRWGAGPDNVTTESVLVISNLADTWHFAPIAPTQEKSTGEITAWPTASRALEIDEDEAASLSGPDYVEIISALKLWAMLHPTGTWRCL